MGVDLGGAINKLAKLLRSKLAKPRVEALESRSRPVRVWYHLYFPRGTFIL